MAYDNTNSGVLFRERDKQGNEARPDYTGKLDVGGHEYRLAGWIKSGQNGDFLSLKLTEPRTQGGSPPPVKDFPSAPADDFDDDIPF